MKISNWVDLHTIPLCVASGVVIAGCAAFNLFGSKPQAQATTNDARIKALATELSNLCQQQTPVPVQPTEMRVSTCPAGVNSCSIELHSQPAGAVVATISPGLQVGLVGQRRQVGRNTWILVDYGGQQAWVSGLFLKRS